jgi:hypothetical protein
MTVIKNLGRHTAAREAADGAPRRGSSSRAADGVADLPWWQAELPVQTAVADLVGAASDEWRGGARPSSGGIRARPTSSSSRRCAASTSFLGDWRS